MKKKRPICPACGEPEPLPILYGYPTIESFEKAERGEIALGGCLVWEDQPNWHCTACGHEFLGRVNLRIV